MKKIITFIAALLILLSAAGCNRGYSSNYMAMGLVESNPSGTAFMSFMTFSGTKVLTLNSSAEGYIKYSAHLTEGSVTVYYDGGEGKTELFSVGEGGSLESSGGHIEKGTVYIIVEAEGSCRDGYLRFEAAAGEPAENGDDEMKKEIDADTYVWEKEGAGGNFAI